MQTGYLHKETGFYFVWFEHSWRRLISVPTDALTAAPKNSLKVSYVTVGHRCLITLTLGHRVYRLDCFCNSPLIILPAAR